MHSEIDQNRQMKWDVALAAILSLAGFWALQILLTSGKLNRLIPGAPTLSNLPAYVITLFLFIAAFCVLVLIIRWIPLTKMIVRLEEPLPDKKYKHLFLVGSAILLLLLAHRRLFAETREFGSSPLAMMHHQLAPEIGVPLFFAMAAAAVIIGLKLRKGRDISRRMLCVCTVLILLLNFTTVLVMDIFHADFKHGVAYTESIYNVYFGAPYTNITTGIYGFHGLFLAPILHLFGGSNLALLAALALLGSAVAVLCVYCIWSLVEENYFRLIALLMCCLSTLAIRTGNYWQLQPHRILWPMILISYVIYLTKKNRWQIKNKLLGYILCALATLWNFESGLFCSVAFAAACVIHDWQQNVWYTGKSLLHLLANIGGVILSLAFAILIVNGYNYLCGWRQWILKDFFFPMFENTYVSGSLEMDLPFGNHAWVYVLTLFGALLLYALYKTSFVRGKVFAKSGEESQYIPAVGALAMLGLCSFSYYANRAAYANLDIVLQLSGIAVCMLWRGSKQSLFQRTGSREDCAKAVVAYVSVVLTMVLAMEAVIFSVPLLGRKINEKHYDNSDYQQACAQLQEAIPENTFAFGGGISWMYAELGWDPIGHYRDFEDLTVGGDAVRDSAAEDALAQDAFAVYLSTDREQEVLEIILRKDPGFTMTKEIELNGMPLQYYTRGGK